MKKIQKAVALLLALVLTTGAFPLSAFATELEPTVPETTVPETTVPETTAPEETTEPTEPPFVSPTPLLENLPEDFQSKSGDAIA